MKIGLLGDIHGNAFALETVLNSAEKHSVEKLLITGDFVGYYFQPKKVLDLLSNWDYKAVKGNHEVMLCRSRLDSEYLLDIDSRYGSGVRTALEELTEDELDKLCSFPHPLSITLDNRQILLCHGSPHDIDVYLYPDTDLSVLDEQILTDFDVIVTGHTHYPMSRVISKHTMIVNPGSVGQPRNRRPGAHWAILDTKTLQVSFYCDHYDTTSLLKECKRRHPGLNFLSEVILRK